MSLAIIHNDHQIQQMRKACKLASDTLVMVGKHLKVGMTTNEINTLVHEYTVRHFAIPAPLNYGKTRNRSGFPKSVCTSINDVICHGIPDDTVLKDGDIINVDVTSIFPRKRGYFGDTSATFYIGEPSATTKHVVETARQSLELGLAQVRPGAYLGDIGYAIQSFAEAKGCSVVREYTGHGIGRVFHGPPNVLHYGRPGQGLRLRKGMTFTVEPMINLHGPDVAHLDDGWTVVTKDGGLSAQFEHTIVVTDTGCEVLTARSERLQNSEDKSWSKLGPLSNFMSK
ncbi:MAG: type I methionyl aminopeptidase [Proteobacteria bacterium]|nr:type I methionyl aminopeptidase [Pseudomonadota bacterium]